MVVPTLQIPGYAAPSAIDFSPLANLGKTYREAQNRQTLADLGKGLSNGSIDYRQAAGQLASTGNLSGVVSLLQLGEAKDKLAREAAASNAFTASLGPMLGGAPQQAPQPSAAPVGPTVPNDSNALPGQAGMNLRLADLSQDFIQDNPGTYQSSGVRSTADQARLYADRANNPNPVAAPGTSRHERGMAVDIGGMSPEQRAALSQYGLSQPVPNDPPHVELAQSQAVPPVQVASNGAVQIPAQTPQNAGIGVAQIPALLGAMANPNLPATQREIAKTLFTRALDESKTPDKIRVLQQLKASSGYQGSILDLEKELKAAGKTEVTVDQRGETEYAKQSAKEFAEMNRKMIEGAQSARMKLGTLSRMGQLLADPNIYTGTGAQQALTAKKLAKAIGIDVGDVSGPEAIQAIGNQFALELRNPAGGAGMPGAMSDKDREFLQASVPGLGQTPEGNRKIVDYMKRVAQRSLDVERLRQSYVRDNKRLDDGFYEQLEKFSNANPMFPEAEQQGGAAQAPAQAEPRRAPDGNMYVPDPNRPGKYLMVQP